MVSLANLLLILAVGYWMKTWKLLYLQRAHHGPIVLYESLHHHLLLLLLLWGLVLNVVQEAGSLVEKVDVQNGGKVDQISANSLY